MKKRVKLFAVACSLFACLPAAPALAADYSAGGIRKNDNTWMNLNGFYMMHTANSFGPAYSDGYFEVEGGARSGALDLYYFFDVNEIMGWGNYYKDAGQFFTKIKPRLSVDALTRRDLALGPVKEWYLATQYKGFNDGEYYSAGPGADLAVPGVDRLSLNFWPKYVRFSGKSKLDYAGLELSLNWYATLWRLPHETTLTYQGWLDYGFCNTYALKNASANQTGSEFQMFNGFYLNKGHYSVSFDVKFHRHLSYYNQNYSNATTWFAGVHYRL